MDAGPADTATAGGAAAFRLLFGGAAFFAPGLATALRSRAWRFARSFFFTWALRRLMFIELRRSCFPTAGACLRGAPHVKSARAESTRTHNAVTNAV